MPDLTYGSLGQSLKAMGFEARDNLEQKARVYQHPGGAAIYLPLYPDEVPVQPRHLLSVRGTLDAFGLPDPFRDDVSDKAG